MQKKRVEFEEVPIGLRIKKKKISCNEKKSAAQNVLAHKFVIASLNFLRCSKKTFSLSLN